MYENEIYGEQNHRNQGGDSGYFDHLSDSTASGVTEENPGKGSGAFQSQAVQAAAPEKRKKAGRVKKEKNRSERKGGVFRKFALSMGMGLCFGLFAGVGFYAIRMGTDQLADSRQEVPAESQTGETSGEVTPEMMQSIWSQLSDRINVNQTSYIQEDASDVVRQVMPAMVSIINNSTASTTSFWGQVYSRPVSYSGSGIIVAQKEDELLIVTNNHVVQGADSLEVTFIDGSTAEAVIKGLDSEMDLAVIAVKTDDLSDDTKNAITIATLGDSDDLVLGEPVIAIGNALGYGQSVSGGMVSALAREITMEDGSKGVFIQTDAAINPGNSGGALLNMKGEVVGINSSKIEGTEVEGMGYAIPITSASPIIAELMERQTRAQKVSDDERGYLGIETQYLDASTSQMFGIPQGAYVYSVSQGSGAEAAGLLHGDIIVSFEGQKISSADELSGALEYYRVGETVKLTVKRIINGEYQSVDLEVTLGRRPE